MAALSGDQGTAWNWVVAVGLGVAAILYLGFPTESIYGGRDEGVYANSAVYLAHHGRLAVPYPWPADLHTLFVQHSVKFPGFYQTTPTMTVQFGHLLPVWLAQAFATFGAAGLFRLNACLSLLAAASFYGVSRVVVPAPVAALATLFFAFNPSQLWMSRITLSEIPSQAFIWSGLLLLVRALHRQHRAAASWAGVLFGLAAFVRLDSTLLLPALVLAHAAWRFTTADDDAAAPVWVALYWTALPVFAAALGYFALFSRPYLEQWAHLNKLVVASVVAGTLLALSYFRARSRLVPWLTASSTLTAVGVAWGALAVYAYWIRSAPNPSPQWQYVWPGYYRDATRDYSRDSLVNFGRYLSPPVVWLGIAGWFAALWQALRGRGERHLLPVLVVSLAFGLAHLTSLPGEDHFWMIRRYLPVVIPALILWAGLGLQWILARLPAPAAPVALLLAALALALFTARADSLILTFAEDAGYFPQIERFAGTLPPDTVILARGATEWITPLYTSFDRRVVPLNLDPGAPGRQVLQAWVARQAAQGQPAYLLLEGAADLHGYQLRQLSETLVSRVFSEPTLTPLPQKTVTQQRTIRLYEVRPEAGPAS